MTFISSNNTTSNSPVNLVKRIPWVDWKGNGVGWGEDVDKSVDTGV